jgi:hypothetical protein
MLRRIWLVAVFAAPALGGTHPSGASNAPGADGRLWLTDAFFDHVTRALRPVISDMICNLPMKQIAGGEKLIEARAHTHHRAPPLPPSCSHTYTSPPA